MSNTGRPTLPASKKRKFRGGIRWLDEEWEEVNRMAKEAHMNLSDFQRVKILRPGLVERDA